MSKLSQKGLKNTFLGLDAKGHTKNEKLEMNITQIFAVSFREKKVYSNVFSGKNLKFSCFLLILIFDVLF